MKIRNMKVMAEAGAEGAGAGGTALGGNHVVAGKVDSGQGKIGDTGTPAWFTLPDKWQDSLPEDLKAEPSLKAFADIPSMAKSLVHAQKQVGRDKVSIPDPKLATPADWKEFFTKTGVVPETIEKYDFKAPEILKADVDSLNRLKQAAYEANISPKAFEKLLNVYGEDLKGQITKNQAQEKVLREKGLAELKTEWGKKYDENLALAQAGLKKYGDEDLTKILNLTGLGDHPALIKAFKNVGESLAEDKIEGTTGDAPKASGNYTPAEALKKANDIMADPSHPYRLGEHPNHKAAVKEVEDLYLMAYPS